MADDTETPGELPRWPADAAELPHVEAPAAPGYDGWLLAAAIAYPVIGYGMLRFARLEVTLAVPLILIAVVIGARLDGARLHWLSVVAFVGWVLVIGYTQLQLWASVG